MSRFFSSKKQLRIRFEEINPISAAKKVKLASVAIFSFLAQKKRPPNRIVLAGELITAAYVRISEGIGAIYQLTGQTKSTIKDRRLTV